MRGSTAGLAEGVINPPAGVHAMFLYLSDIIFSSLILGPAIVIYWRGTWNYSDIVLKMDNPLISALISLGIGIIGHLVFTIFQKKLDEYCHPDKHRILFLFGSRLYTYAYGIVCVHGWRAGWMLMDLYLARDVFHIFTITFVSAVILSFMKGIRNISATPFSISTDHSKNYFAIPTYFKAATNEPAMFLLDCFFSVLVIGTLVVFVWRGMWVLCDLLIYPEDRVMSAWGSMVIGYGVVALTFGFQSLIRWACDNLKGWFRIILADLYLFFSFIGSVNVWRGIWMVTDEYFMTDNKLLGDILTHSISFILLALLNCANSILVRGVYIDAEEPAGQCVIFPIYYIRLFFQKERTKKQQRLLDALDKYDPQNKMSLLPTSEKKPTIVSSSNNVHGNDVKAIELQAMLNTNVQNVDETISDDEQNVINQLNKNDIS